MQNIDVRAWHKYRKIMKPCNLYTNPLGEVRMVQLRGDNNVIPVDAVELMFGTGKNDEHGRRVYDGDIIADSSGDTMVVFWHHDSCGFMKRPLDDDGMNFTSGLRNMRYWRVIGNIYENKELLEQPAV